MSKPSLQPAKKSGTGRLRKPRSGATGSGLLRRPVRAHGWLLVLAGAVVFPAVLLTLRPDRETGETARDEDRLAAPAEIPRVRFTDVTAQAGIDFVHNSGARGEKLLPETMGGGCAFLDFDSDGDQDLLFVNSRPWPGDLKSSSAALPTMALYRNDGRGNFDDVTAGSGLDVALYGMGAAVGDYNNDGRIDVFLSAVGGNRLFRNEGNGRFVDVTGTAGVAGDANEWSTGCGWFDYDNDGDLDLFVCNYLKWSPELDAAHNFRFPGGGRAYGRPQNFQGAFPYLYRNDGDGTFTDVSQQSGIQVRDARGNAAGKSLGVTFNDFDGDGFLEVVIANDTVPNQLLHNRGNGTFEEIGALAGIAFDRTGNARGAMGIDSAHFRNNEAVGVAIGNFSNEMSALYVSYDNLLQFTDEAPASGLGPGTHRELTFGVCYVDYDLDGRLDVFAANGHLEPEIHRVQPAQQFEQPPQMFWNSGSNRGGEFRLVPKEKCGRDFVRPMVGRGAAFADIDADGDLDLLVTAAGRAPRLLRNDQNLGHHWLRLKLVGTRCNSGAIGAKVEVRLPDRTLRRHVMPTRSYLSQVELPLTFGLGTSDRVESVTVHWPDGSKQTVGRLEVDRAYEIEQGSDSITVLSIETGRGAGAANKSADNSAVGRDAPASRMRGRAGSNRKAYADGSPGSTCGDYLHFADFSEAGRSPAVPSSGQPGPCRGPWCSRVPDGPSAPPSAPRLVKQHQDGLFCAAVPPDPGRWSRRLPPDSAAQPQPVRERIFRPPRCG